VYRRDTLIRAGVRYARHVAMLRSRRPRKCDGPIKQKMLWVGKNRARTPRGALVRGKCAGRLLANDDKLSISGVRTSRDTRSDQSACQIRGPREA
jgi:hypothetical protein